MPDEAATLGDVVEAVAGLHGLANELGELQFADERGWLRGDGALRMKELAGRLPVLQAALAERWRGLDDEEMAGHERRVHDVLGRMRDAGGRLGSFYLESLAGRALATCAPERRFDVWAVWAVYQL